MGLGRWLFRKNYKPFEIPEGVSWLSKSNDEMTIEEGRQHFEWYTGISEERSDYLLEFSSDHCMKSLQFSPESLVDLWDALSWGIKGRKIKPNKSHLSQMEIEMGLDKPYIMPDGFTCILAFDLGHIYYRIFKKYYPHLSWSIGLKKDGQFNQPVVKGFKVPLVPEELALSCLTSGVKKKAKPTILLDCYRIWEGHL